MRRLMLCGFLLALAGAACGSLTAVVYAQSGDVCGCAFVQGQAPVNVTVQFRGSPSPTLPSPGTVVYRGDLLIVRRPVTATLRCDNSGNVPLKNLPRRQPVPCIASPSEGIFIGYRRRRVDPTLSASLDTGFPQVVSPRATKLIERRPVLRWTTVGAATVYKVIVRGESGSWSVNVPASPSGDETQQITYPALCAAGVDAQPGSCAPPLKPGATYKLIVEANGRSSEDEGAPNLGFTLLTDETTAAVKTEAAKLVDAPLPEFLKVQMLASLYANRGLKMEAIEKLEGDPRTLQTPEAIRLLGGLYLTIGLTRKAELHYLQLLSPDLQARDTPDGLARTNFSLAEIYETLGSKEAAVKYYAEARRLFAALKDQETLAEIDRHLNALPKQ
jgi:hypothetical protein